MNPVNVRLKYSEAIEKQIQKLKTRNDIPEHSRTLILEFIERQLSIGVGVKRVLKYCCVLPSWSIWFGKEFKEVNQEDVTIPSDINNYTN